jgi:hypothetical protein
MRNLVAVPVILLAVIVQSSVISQITVLKGFADLPLVMLAAWALQEEVDSAWHWAIAAGILVGLVSGILWVAPLAGYLATVAFAQGFRRRVWQAPLLAMFTITFFGAVVTNIITFVVLRFSNIALALDDALGLIILPSILLDLILAIPVYVVMRDLARWVYPAPEVE